MRDLRFALLGSGSRGNAMVVEYGDTRVLLDAGFSARQIETRLGRLGMTPADLDAVVITHEHSDHWRGASRLSLKHRLPVWMTAGTHAATAADAVHERTLFSPHERFTIGALELAPYPIPHDAREPAQVVIGNGDKRLGVLSDSGFATPHIRQMINGCDALVVEANHDTALLADGPYPPMLKRRVASAHGHLSNDQAAELIDGLDTGGLQHIVVAHISESNNRPALARNALGRALGCADAWVEVADQREGLAWRSLENH